MITRMRVLLGLLTLSICATVYAQTLSRGVQLANQSSTPCATGTSCVWSDNTPQVNIGATAIPTNIVGEALIEGGSCTITTPATTVIIHSTVANGIEMTDTFGDAVVVNGGVVQIQNGFSATATFESANTLFASPIKFTPNATGLSSAGNFGTIYTDDAVGTKIAYQNDAISMGGTGITVATNGTFFRPAVDGQTTLGDASHGWNGIYSTLAAIGTALAAGITATNPTAATSVLKQNGPAISSVGQCWNTTAGASQPVGYAWQTLPTSGATAGGSMALYAILNGVSTQLLTLTQNGANATLAFQDAGATISDTSGDALILAGGVALINAGGQQVLNVQPNIVYSRVTTTALGNPANRWFGTSSTFYETAQGAQLTAAATITPTTGLHHVTGLTAITTIAATNLAGNATLTLIADSATITYSTGGNISTAGTITLGNERIFTYDATASMFHPAQ